MRNLVFVPLSLSLLATGIHAAHAAEQPVYELITTAIHRQQSETALPVTVLTGEALRSQVRATLGDTLATQPGISNASFGPAVGQTVIRGQQGRRVMTLTNGIPNADASGNSADHAQTVEPLLAESVEVLRGPATLLYGGGAIGGVVNVIDRRIARQLPAENAFSLEARHDTAADSDTVVGSADLATGNLVWHLDAMQREWNDLDVPGLAIDPAWLAFEEAHEHEHEGEHEEEHEEEVENTDGFIANTGGHTRSWTLGTSWVGDKGHIGFAVNRLDSRYGLPPGAHDHGHGHDEEHGEDREEEHEEHGSNFVYIDMERRRYDVDAEWRGLADWAEKIQYRLTVSDYAHAEIEGGGEIGTRFANESSQQRLQITHTDTALRHGVLGLQHSNEAFAALGEESFIPVTDIQSSGLFLIEDFHRGPVTIELGGRFNRDRYNPDHGLAPALDFDTWSFSGSALWDVNANATLALALARAQRAPSVEELYSNYGLDDPEDCVIHFATGACELGNTGFGEESSLNLDLTLNLELGMLAGTVTLFHNDFKDYIGLVSTGMDVDAFPIREYRQDDARFTGIEIDATLQLTTDLALRLFGDSIRGRFERFGDVPRLPPVRYGLQLDYGRDAWNLNLGVVHGAAQDRPGSDEFRSAAWTRIEAGADYRISLAGGGEVLLFLKARNIGDEDIRLSTSFLRNFAPEAGRSLETGVRVSF